MFANRWLFAIFGLAAVASAPVVSGAEAPPFNTWAGASGRGRLLAILVARQINKSNVKQLEVAWTYPTGEGSYLFNPIVIDNVMYVQAKK
jgi:quinoprotein glucose dehydrogenase